MNADDDGIVEAYSVLKITGSGEDNLRVLVAKNFVRILNDDLVSHIIDWNEHNLIRADRKVDSIYKDLLLQIVPTVELIEARPRADLKPKKLDSPRTDNGQPTDGIGKVSIGKVSIGKVSIGKKDKPAGELRDVTAEMLKFDEFWTLYNKKIDRSKCEKLWLKISSEIYPLIFAHVERYVVVTPDKQFRKNPETYLKNQCWNNEIISQSSIGNQPFDYDKQREENERLFGGK